MADPHAASGTYDGDEPAVSPRSIPRPSGDDYFQVSKFPIPVGAIPIVDDDTDTAIGYRRVVQGNTWTCDIDGALVSIDEPGLGTPLIDPLDVIFVVGAIGRFAVRSAARASLGMAGEVTSHATAQAIASSGAATLRYAFRRLVQRELQFTATTAARMAQPGRYVPIDILKLAIRYGVRDVDPQAVPGVFRYTIPMLKAGKRLGDPPRRFILRVIVREKDWTVLHFHYNR